MQLLEDSRSRSVATNQVMFGKVRRGAEVVDDHDEWFVLVHGSKMFIVGLAAVSDDELVGG